MSRQVLESSEWFCTGGRRGPGPHWYAKHTHSHRTHVSASTYTSAANTATACRAQKNIQTHTFAYRAIEIDVGMQTNSKRWVQFLHTHTEIHTHKVHTNMQQSAVPTVLALNNSAFLPQCCVNNAPYVNGCIHALCMASSSTLYSVKRSRPWGKQHS